MYYRVIGRGKKEVRWGGEGGGFSANINNNNNNSNNYFISIALFHVKHAQLRF